MTQNEKDRELLDMCASNRENGWCIDTMGDEGDMLYEIANRLLTERENALQLWLVESPETNSGYECSSENEDFYDKGIWILTEKFEEAE
ncbi:hypothetical protein [Listeria booriae]|uniref:hypothetical protein n=1 Tax=Listeria booriae TaxID=1552123 RepID=UPI0016253502|nr:hypothetical protein [Listeria booriae]MBC2048237.1 hypothetical protein [Listeria booriae]